MRNWIKPWTAPAASPTFGPRRTHGFLAAILSYSLRAWEELSIFLSFLIPKLPAPKEEDLIAVDFPAKVLADKAYENAIKNSDRENARIEHDRVLQRVMVDLMADDTGLYRLYSDDDGFRKWLADAVFGATYGQVEQGGTLASRSTLLALSFFLPNYPALSSESPPKTTPHLSTVYIE